MKIRRFSIIQSLKRGGLIPIFGISLFFTASLSLAEKQDEIKKFLDEVGSVEHFLSSDFYQQRLYELLVKKHGSTETFPIRSYDHITRMLKKFRQRLSDTERNALDQRLWSHGKTSKELDGMIIHSERKEHGLQFKEKEFIKYLESQQKKLKIEMRVEIEKSDHKKSWSHQELKENLLKLSQQYRDAQKNDRIKDFFIELRNNHLYQFFIRKLLHLTYAILKDKLIPFQSADEILEWFYEFKSKPYETMFALLRYFPENENDIFLDPEIHPALFSEISRLIPSIKQLKKLETVFEPKMIKAANGKTIPLGQGQKVTVQLRSVSHRLITLYKGILNDECTAGGRNFTLASIIDNSSVKRIFSALEQDSEFYEVWISSESISPTYNGFIQWIPVSHSTKKPLYAVDIGASILRRITKTEFGKKPLSLSIIRKHRKKETGNASYLVPGEFDYENNAYIFQTLRVQPEYIWGTRVNRNEFIGTQNDDELRSWIKKEIKPLDTAGRLYSKHHDNLKIAFEISLTPRNKLLVLNLDQPQKPSIEEIETWIKNGQINHLYDFERAISFGFYSKAKTDFDATLSSLSLLALRKGKLNLAKELFILNRNPLEYIPWNELTEREFLFFAQEIKGIINHKKDLYLLDQWISIIKKGRFVFKYPRLALQLSGIHLITGDQLDLVNPPLCEDHFKMDR